VYLVDLALDKANESTDVNMYFVFVGIAGLGRGVPRILPGGMHIFG
jgi:hypothetical protein